MTSKRKEWPQALNELKPGECGLATAALVRDALLHIGVSEESIAEIEDGDWNFVGGYVFAGLRAIREKHDSLTKQETKP